MAEQANSAIPMVIGLAVARHHRVHASRGCCRGSAPARPGSGAASGATLALALIASTLAMNYGFEARPLSLWLINAGYMVVGMAMMGAIIGAWRKKA